MSVISSVISIDCSAGNTDISFSSEKVTLSLADLQHLIFLANNLKPSSYLMGQKYFGMVVDFFPGTRVFQVFTDGDTNL